MSNWPVAALTCVKFTAGCINLGDLHLLFLLFSDQSSLFYLISLRRVKLCTASSLLPSSLERDYPRGNGINNTWGEVDSFDSKWVNSKETICSSSLECLKWYNKGSSEKENYALFLTDWWAGICGGYFKSSENPSNVSHLEQEINSTLKILKMRSLFLDAIICHSGKAHSSWI